MADNADARARGAIERIFAQAKKRETIKGFVGKPNGNGTYTIYTGYAPGWVYVRLTDAVDGSIAIAIAMNTNLDPAVEVEMERVDGMLVIKTAVPAQAARLYGNSTPQAQQPPQQQPPTGYTNKQGGELSLVNAAGNALGGLVARITAYRHRGGWWPGTDTITLTPTSNSGKRAWVLVGINTKTNAITQALTEDRSVGYTPFPESDVNAVINLYPDVDWRAAVNVANGETSIDVSDILDLTNRGESKPKSNYTATAAPTVNDDIDDGYGVGSVWIDVTGDNAYTCVDATAGAAVWRQINGGTSASLPAFGTATTLTLASDVAAAGTARHLVLAAQTSVTDDLIEVTGLGVGDEVIIAADAGDTITVKHNSGSATDKIMLHNGADIALSGDMTLKLVKRASGKVVQYVDESGTGSGGLTHTYVGYNTAGGSNTSMVGGTAYMKKITLAADGWLGAIGVYIDHTAATNVQTLAAWVMSDNAGTPDLVIGVGANWNSTSFFINTTARWVDIAIGKFLTAGDYWLVVQRPTDGGSDLRIYYDGSGSDKTQAIGAAWNADGNLYSISSTTNKYSIRGSILT